MNEENQKKSEIKLTTIVMLILFLLIVIVAVVIVSTKNKSHHEPTQPSTSNHILDYNLENEAGTPVIISTKNSEFQIDFLKLENQKQNMIYSPLSIKYALYMLNDGASGNTKKQIEKLLEDQSLTKYNNIDKVLSLANSIFVKNDYKQYIKEDYKNTLKQKYDAEVNYDAFENAQNVNKWIENKTLGIIPNMLQDETVRLNRTLLINALAIDMEWQLPFETDKTYGEEFYLENGNKITATMMQKEVSNDDIQYYKDEDVTALSMNLKKYEDTQLEFIAIMPKENLSDYVKDITTSDISKIEKQLKPASKAKNGLKIKVPKFSFDYSLKLKDDLINLGMIDAFDSEIADFSKMAETDFFVSEALHKANIDFTEKGIKAAAVTVFAMKDNAMIVEKQPEEIKIDRPFLYIIKDKNTDEIWFVGTVYEPNSWEKDKADYQAR